MLLQSDKKKKKQTKNTKTRKNRSLSLTYRQSPVETLGVLTEESHFFLPCPLAVLKQ